MRMTKHAGIRAGQRGFPESIIKIIESNGTCVNAPGGAIKVSFNKKQYRKAVSDLKGLIQWFDRAKGGTLIVKGDQILTLYKREG